MIIIIDDRELVIEGFRKGFDREGVAAVGFSPDELNDWLRSLPDTELEAIEGVLLGCCQLAADMARDIRERVRAPLIAMSERNSLNEVLELFSVGVDDVVRKPVHVREIIARINAIMRRGQQEEKVLQAGEIRVFPDGRPPLVAGEPLNLPRREYRILHYLVTHKNRRVTKRQLFDYVYGIFEDGVEESVIESHISKLRKKLRRRLGYDPIDSRRYLGYCLHDNHPLANGNRTRDGEMMKKAV